MNQVRSDKNVNTSLSTLVMLAVALVTMAFATACGDDEQADDPAVRAESLGDAVADSDGSGESDASMDDGQGAGGSIQTGEAGESDDDESDDDATDDADEAASPQADDSALGDEAAAAVGGVLNETGDGLTGTDLEEHLAQRYEAYWHAFDVARRAPTAAPEIDYPVLYSLAAGEQLESAYDELNELYSSGDAVREPEVAAVEGLDPDSARRVRIESLEGGVAELVACSVYDNVRYNVATGEVVNDGVRSVETSSTMARHEGVWKVIRSRATGLEVGVGGCWNDEGGSSY